MACFLLRCAGLSQHQQQQRQLQDSPRDTFCVLRSVTVEYSHASVASGQHCACHQRVAAPRLPMCPLRLFEAELRRQQEELRAQRMSQVRHDGFGTGLLKHCCLHVHISGSTFTICTHWCCPPAAMWHGIRVTWKSCAWLPTRPCPLPPPGWHWGPQ